MIELQTKLNSKDAFRLQMVVLKNTFLNYTLATMFLMGIITCIHSLSTRSFDFINLILPFLGIFIPVLSMVNAYLIAKRIINEAFVFKYPISYQVTPEFLTIDGYQTATKIHWSNAFNYAEDKYAFYVYISSLQAYILPKRDIKPEELPEVQLLISSNVKKKKYTVKRVISIITIIIFALVIITTLTTW